MNFIFKSSYTKTMALMLFIVVSLQIQYAQADENNVNGLYTSNDNLINLEIAQKKIKKNRPFNFESIDDPIVKAQIDMENVETLDFLEKAAIQGNPQAQFFRGEFYRLGLYGSKKDRKQGILWLEKSAGNDYALAQYTLGSLYQSDYPTSNNPVIKKDFEKSIYWLERSAKNGYSKAQLQLSVIYYNGEGVPKNLTKAKYWSKMHSDNINTYNSSNH